MDLLGLRVGPAQQDRGHEGPAVDDADASVRAGDLRRIERAVGKLPAGVEHGLDGGAHVGELLEGGQGAHRDALGAGVTEHDAFADAVPYGGDDVGHQFLRHDRAADGGAFLSGLGGHLGDEGLDEGVEFRRALDGIRAQDRGVEGVGLGREADPALDHVGVGLQRVGGRGRAREGHEVAVVQVIQQGADGAGNQLQRALGQDAGFVDRLDHGGGHVAGGGSRLDDGGHAGEEGRGELLQHAPDGEVEGVDLHRDAGDAGVDVLAGERTVPGQHLHGAIHHHLGVGEFPAALGPEGEQDADAAVDVDHRVDLGGAGLRRERVELLAAAVEVLREFLELEGPLVEGQRAQFRLAGGAAVIHDAGEVESLGAHLGQEFTGAGVQDRCGTGCGGGVGGPPGTPDEAGNDLYSVYGGYGCGGHR